MEAAMATKITAALEDDLDGGPATETVRSGLGRAQYEDRSEQEERPGVPEAPGALRRARP
jgi:hypothetical protein